MVTGQVTIQQEFGRMLYDLSVKSEIKNIFEVGTWRGQGSTLCFVLAIKDSKKESQTTLYSIEANKDMYEFAKKFYTEDTFVKIIHGRIVEIEEIPHKEEYFDSMEYLTEMIPPHERHLDWKGFLRSDIESMKSCQDVSNQLPESIDLLLLDGGDFTSYNEYRKLKDKVKYYIALDDTNVLKNRKSQEELLSDKDFECIRKSNDRNGWSVFKRI